MALTAAERMKRYREKLKSIPGKYEEHKKKHAKLVKDRTKKITEFTEKEKETIRKKWREQKRKQKEKKVGNLNVSTKTLTTSKGNTEPRRRFKIMKQHKAALKRIHILTTILDTTRKQFYRYKIKSAREIEQLKECVTKMKIREEVLESTLKSTYKNCRTHKQKKVLKSFVETEIVAETKMKSNFSKLLGLTGKIRKSKESVKNVKIRCELQKFFTRDDVSRCTAGKKETRTVKKKKEQIRYLTDTLHNLHQIYKSEGGKCSFTTFYRYKPFFVLSPNVQNRDTCLCMKHSNIDFQLRALQKKGIITNYKHMPDILKLLSCDLESYKCMYGTCKTCTKTALDYKLKEGQIDFNVEWFQWKKINHEYQKDGKNVKTKKTVKVKNIGTINSLIKSFEECIPVFKKHYFTYKHQQKQYQKCVSELKKNEALIICDFSENYQCKLANETQSMHFGASKVQITLHTGMVYWSNACQSFCTVSDSKCHEPPAIWAHLIPVIKMVKETKSTTVIHFYSDGPSSQYRQKNNFFLLNLFTFKLGLKYSTWSFTESGHGKGVADGIGGAVKRALDRQVAYGKDISNGQAAHDILQNCMKTVKCFFINSGDIENIKKVIPEKLKPVPETMKIHQIATTTPDVIIHRTHSCFCTSKKGLCSCFSPKKYTFKVIDKTLDASGNKSENKKKNKRHIKKNEKKNKTENSLKDEKEDEMRYETGDETRYDDVIVVDQTEKREINEPDHSNGVSLQLEPNNCIGVDEIAVQKQITEDTVEEYVVVWDKNLNSRAIVSPIMFPLVDTKTATNDSKIQIEPIPQSKIEQHEHEITKNITESTFETNSGLLPTSNLKSKYSEANQINLVKKRLHILEPRDYNQIKRDPLKVIGSNISRKKQNNSLKIVVKRTVPCNRCKAETLFQIGMVKCMACKQMICSTCSQGQQICDYICDTCLGV